MRHLTLIDKFLTQANNALETIFTVPSHTHDNPAQTITENALSESERKNSIGCMRVNHTGEVCAQALYRGQLIACRNKKTRVMLEQSCEEESNHLAWTQERLTELQGKTSFFNPFFYGNSFFIGLLAGMIGDAWSLGFVEETEIQVAKHLSGHLKKISVNDRKSRTIIEQMREDEITHEKKAVAAGAHQLPEVVKKIMQLQSKVMTTVTYWV